MTLVHLLCEYPTISGGENSMLATLDGVRRAGFRVAVIAPPNGPLAEALMHRDVRVLPFHQTDPSGKRWSQEERRRQLATLLERERPGILHANSLSMGRLSGPVADDLSIRSITHIRDIVKLSRQAIDDLNRHDRLLVVSEATRSFHVAAGLDVEKTHVLYNGVDLQAFRPGRPTGSLHRELGLPPDAPLVGAIGQIGLRKGFDVLAEAALLLRKELPEVHYLFVGRRWSEKAESRQFETELHNATDRIPGRMHLIGFRRDISDLLRELTLLVHPARQEPLGRVLLEAAASGLPIVATDVGGTREIFPTECRAARLVEPDNVDATAAAMLELLRNDTLLYQTAAAARRRAEAAFDAERATERLIEHYRGLMVHPTDA